MFPFKLNQVFILLIFHGCDCQRRITDGNVVSGDKRYVVYLLKASISPRFYSSWLCGGALVSEEYIVTSAACVTDVTHLYAIAGYNKYISDIELYSDPCTKDKKKKIIFICTPMAYKLMHTQPQIWSNIDIAVAKVESPYDFTDTSYTDFCSYIPAAIEINYDSKYQEAGIDAIVLGWGHRTSYREEMDLANHNQAVLNYAPTLIESKEECKREYELYDGMDKVIEEYMICTNQAGNLNDVGAAILAASPTAQGCKSPLSFKLRADVACQSADVPEDQIVLVENARKDIKATNFSRNGADQKLHSSSLINKMNKTVLNSRRTNTRRHGICQNDHGGPLVTWVGAHEKLIGVASAYKITENLECIGPNLYTSTQCNGAFLDCILKNDPTTTEPMRRRICSNLFKEQGLKLVETHISWEDHPDGPAENEKNRTTPVSAVNTDTNNVTVKPITSKEERNKTYQEKKATKLVNTNITNTNDTTTTHSIIDTNLTKTTKAVNVGDSTPMNLNNINAEKFKKSSFVILTSGNSTNLINNTFTNLTNINTTTTKTTSTKYQTNASMSLFENTITTILMKNATTNHRNTKTTNVYLKTTNTNFVNATLTTITLVDTATKNETK